jgi:hypothetical protein
MRCRIGTTAAQAWAILPRIRSLSPSTVNLHFICMSASAGLGQYNGLINLRTSFLGFHSDLLAEAGSVDQTMSYVFETPPQREAESGGRILSYWNTVGDTDTMFTLWNYSGTTQDVILTFQHQEGKYEMPIHLAPHASMTFSVGKLIRGGVPDRNGNIIPTNILQGSAKITGPNISGKDRFSVAVFAGIFNARTGTCSYPCVPCNVATEALLTPTGFQVPVGNSFGVTLWVVFSDGSEENFTSSATYSSSNTSVATTNGSNTNGIAVGSAIITGLISVQGAGSGHGRYTCCGVQGCGEQVLSDSGAANVTPQITSVSPAQGVVGTNVNPVTITGVGFGTSMPTVNASGGISVLVSTHNNTQIVAGFNISPGASPGPQSVTVTVTGGDNTSQTSNAVSFLLLLPPTFDVQYVSFIPVDNVTGPDNCSYPTNNGTTVALIYKGDANRGTFRTGETVQVVPDLRSVSFFSQATGQTRNYGFGSPAVGSTLSSADEDGVALDCFLWNNAGQAVPNFSNNDTYPAAHKANVELTGSSSNPLAPLPAPIAWDMTTSIDGTSQQSPTASVTYTHTCYPAHQVKVNGQVVYLYIPPRNDVNFITNCLLLHLGIVSGQTGSVQVPTQ